MTDTGAGNGTLGDLRYCIDNAPSNSTIVFNVAAGSTIDLNSALTINNKNFTIDGKALDITINGNISGPTICRIFTITGTSNVEIDNLTLASAKAASTDQDGNGGAIYDHGGSLTLTSDDFLQNVASNAGGAVFTDGLTGPLTVTNCNFSGNIASGDGGAIEASTAMQNVVLKNSTFTTNVATGDGGAIHADDGPGTQLSMSACTFEGNHTGGSGSGGAVFTTDQFQDEGSTYTNNYAREGGAINWATPPLGSTAAKVVVKLSYDTFTSNQAETGGAVTFVADATQGTVTQTILGCLFNANKAWNFDGQQSPLFDGGGLSATEIAEGTGSTALNVYNSTFYQNIAEGNGEDGSANGGGIDLFIHAAGTGTNTTTLTSLTIYDNSATLQGDGGGVYVDPTSSFGAANAATPGLMNSIIADNQCGPSDASSGPDIYGAILTRGHNLIGDTFGITLMNPGGTWLKSDIVGTLGNPKAPGLDPNGLTDNGGPTLTIKPVDGSDALNHGNPNLDIQKDGTQLDQRGFTRPAMKTTIGAYEPGAKVVQQGQSSTTVASSANPAKPDQSVTLTAEVTTNAGTPTGTVTFLDGNTVLETVPLDAYGFASLSTSTLALGSHNITTTYSGDDDSAGSSGTLTQVISQENSSFLSLSSSASTHATLNQAVTFTATINGSSGIPTGTVTFLDGDTILDTTDLDGTGKATFTTSDLLLGSHAITAIYGGDSTYGSNSAILNQTVVQGGTFTSVNLSLNPAQPGQPVTFTATVLPEGSSGTPSGTVTFLDGSIVLGTGTLTQVGSQMQATFTTSTLSSGSHIITAIYGGDDIFMASSASATETIGQASGTGSAASVTASANPAVLGQAVTLTATVSGFSGTPSGSVTFFDGTTVLGSASVTLVAGQAKATLTLSTLGLGAHDIVAVYSGDGTYAASASSLMLTVNQGSTTTTLTSSANPSPLGQDVTFTATVAAMGMGAGTPSGTVSFYDGTTFLGVGELTLVNGQMQATFTTAALGLGSHRILAIYTGDSTFADSGASLAETINS